MDAKMRYMRYALVYAMACRLFSVKLLPQTMMIMILLYIKEHISLNLQSKYQLFR